MDKESVNIQNSDTVINSKQNIFRSIYSFINKYNNDWTSNFAAAIAYNLLTSVVSILIALLSIIGFFLGSLAPINEKNLINNLQNAFHTTIITQDLIHTITFQLSKVSGTLGIIAFVVAIFGGSRLFMLLENCFDVIYRLKSRGAIAQNIMSFGMIILFSILIPSMVLTSSIPAFIETQLHLTLINTSYIHIIFTTVGILTGILIAFIFFSALYLIIPNQKIDFKKNWKGSLFSAIALQAYLLLFPLYVTRFFQNGYVGQVGFVIILLAFFYYFAMIILIGAEINAFYGYRITTSEYDIATYMYKSGENS